MTYVIKRTFKFCCFDFCFFFSKTLSLYVYPIVCFQREFNACLYLTYYIFQEAIEACLKFDNHQMFDYNCYLSCKLDNDNYQELAKQEIRSLMHAHLPIFDENVMEKQDEKFVSQQTWYIHGKFFKFPTLLCFQSAIVALFFTILHFFKWRKTVKTSTILLPTTI